MGTIAHNTFTTFLKLGDTGMSVGMGTMCRDQRTTCVG